MATLAPAWAGMPSPEVKRKLFPAQAALAVDSLVGAEREARAALALDPNVTEAHLILAESFWRRGLLHDAQVEYEKARQLGDAAAEAQAGLALVALGEDDLASAETCARAALAADKGLWLANFAMGRVLLLMGHKDEAFEHFAAGKGTKDRSQRRDLFETGMGLVALAEKDPQGAETNFIRARAMAPNTVEHVMNLAAMYEATDQWSQAANLLETAQEKVGSSPPLSFRLGRALEKQQQWNDALRQYQRALQVDSTFAPALAAVGHLYLMDRSKIAAAVDLLSRAVELRPTIAARFDLGIALTRANRAAEALPHLEAALQDDPSPEAKLALARAYLQTDAADKALKLYEDPDVVLVAQGSDLLQVGVALSKAKDFDNARKFLNMALERDSKLSDVHYRLGYIDLTSKNYEAAIENFQKKVLADPKSAATYMNMGMAYQGLGKMAEAAASYRQATALVPNSSQAWYLLGGALVGVDSVAAAQRAYAKALGADPQNVAAKRGQAYTYLRQEKYTQAISLLREVVQADPNDSEAWVWLGQALLNSGNLTEARRAFEQAQKLDPGNKSAQEGLQLIDGATKSGAAKSR